MNMRQFLISALLSVSMDLALVSQGGEPAFSAKDRLSALFICPPHGYNGEAAAECTLLESLSNVRFTAVQVPHGAGDQVSDVDAHFGADDRWIALRKAEVLRQLERPYDAVILAADVTDAEIQQALVAHVTRGGVLIWLLGDKAPDWLAVVLKPGEGASTPAPAISPLAGLGLEWAGMKLGGKMFTNGLAVVHALPGGTAPTPLAAYATVGRGRVLSIASSNGSLFPASFAAGIDGDWLWSQAFERLVRFAAHGTVSPAVTVEVAPAEPNAADVVEG